MLNQDYEESLKYLIQCIHSFRYNPYSSKSQDRIAAIKALSYHNRIRLSLGFKKISFNDIIVLNNTVYCKFNF